MQEPSIDKDELKDQLQMFKANPIWQILLQFMQRLYMDAAEEALNASDMGAVKKASGVAMAVKMVSEFENYIEELKS